MQGKQVDWTPNRNTLFETHLSLHDLIWPKQLNFDIRGRSSTWLTPITAHPKKVCNEQLGFSAVKKLMGTKSM